MARLKLTGLDDYAQSLAKLSALTEVERVMKGAVFAGAEVVADAIRAEIDALPVGSEEHGTIENKIRTITRAQKTGLQNGFGLSKMQSSDQTWHTKAGFNGYNSTVTKHYPNGQPNSMIAASLENGASFREKNPFITRALRKSRQKALEAMEASADATINEIMEGK